MLTCNIFIPENFCLIQSGYFSGKFLFGSDEFAEEPLMIIIDQDVSEELQDDTIGLIQNGRITRAQLQSNWVVLQTFKIITVQRLRIRETEFSSDNFNLILYDPLQIKNSCLLPKFFSHQNNNSCKNLEYFFNRIHDREKNASADSLTSHIIYRNVIFHYLFTISSLLKGFFKKFSDFLERKFDAKSHFICQLWHRLNQLEKFYELCSSKCDKKLGKNCVLGILVFDVFFGLLSSFAILRYSSAENLYSWFHSVATIVASNVQDLLNWLRGVPAGLKLNQPLAESLSSFFSYHVYLWMLYLDVARPSLALLIQLFVFSGVFGVSVQIALLSDLLNLAVIHIHCFYIYAARLHMLQMSLLGSQWRAFRGLKWNPLKGRVDTHCEEDHLHLTKILSSVGLTLVVFLLPTSIVYYAVFVTLRLLLLSLQGFVSVFLWLLNWNPAYIILLHLRRSPLLAGNLHFDMIPPRDQNDSQMKLRLSVTQSSLQESLGAFSATIADVLRPVPKPDLRRMWSSLVYAQKLL